VNAVFRIHTTEPACDAQPHVLRLRKETPHTTPYAQQAVERLAITSLFDPAHLIQQSLTHVPTALIATLNLDLRKLERADLRPPHRRGVYLATDHPHGLLLDDMTAARDGTTTLALEFKPKWLVQSRDAPADSVRCRTCALRAMRRHKDANPRRAAGGGGGDNVGFCPLDLAAGESERPVDALLQGRDVAAEARARLQRYLAGAPVIARLRELQARLDTRGVLAFEAAGGEGFADLLVCMAVRDCSLYVRVPVDPCAEVEGRLGDLDLKLGREKLEYWAGVERGLIDGGWYRARNGRAGGALRTGCRLER